MKWNCRKPALLSGLGVLAILAMASGSLLRAQPWDNAPAGGVAPNRAMAQQNARSLVQAQVTWLQSATRSASRYGDGDGDGYGLVWRQFQALQGAYNAFKGTLSQSQLSLGANQWAKLDAGLGVLEEAFTGYQQAVASGQSSASAFDNMCQALNQGAEVWLREFNADCSSLLVGWR